MGWIARSFGRAIIYNTVREGFYQAHHPRRVRPVRVVERLHPQDKETLVQFVCSAGHHFTLPFTGKHPDRFDLNYQDCPECGAEARWLAMDYHVVNLQA